MIPKKKLKPEKLCHSSTNRSQKSFYMCLSLILKSKAGLVRCLTTGWTDRPNTHTQIYTDTTRMTQCSRGFVSLPQEYLQLFCVCLLIDDLNLRMRWLRNHYSCGLGDFHIINSTIVWHLSQLAWLLLRNHILILSGGFSVPSLGSRHCFTYLQRTRSTTR